MLLSDLLKESLDTTTLECGSASGRRRDETRSVSFAHQKSEISGDVHESKALVQPIRTLRVLRTPVRAFAVRIHAVGLSLRETEAILRLLGVERSFQAVFQWGHRLSDSVSDPPKAAPRWVAVDETAVKNNRKWSWLYAAIDLDTNVILDVALFKRHGTDPAAAFLHGVCEKHDCSETVFLADAFGYRTVFSRLRLSGRATTQTET